MRDAEEVLPGQIFNYRQSRARLTIEYSFGILVAVVARWRIFECPIQAKADNVKFFVLACLCLHNAIMQMVVRLVI